MKYLVASDIHGSTTGARLVLDAYERSGSDAILLLGDILYHGPRNPVPQDYAPKEVIAMLNPESDRILAIKGNCDGEVDQMVLDFPVLGTYSSFMIGKRRIFISHGHTYSPSNLPKLKRGDIFLSGHTHIPTAEVNEDGIYLLNPGSTGIPKGGSDRDYGILTEEGFTVLDHAHQEVMHIAFNH